MEFLKGEYVKQRGALAIACPARTDKGDGSGQVDGAVLLYD